jgi:hypothetical protein
MAAIRKEDRISGDALYVEAHSQPDPNSGCWLWDLALFRNGYGAVSRRSERLAHRMSYRAFRGEIPDGMFVCHRCDTRSCVNPAHLFLGTHSDNMRDMSAKGRHWLVKNPARSYLNGQKLQRAFGERKPNAIITAALAAQIRARHLAGERVCDLIRETGLNKNVVYKAAKGQSWRRAVAILQEKGDG